MSSEARKIHLIEKVLKENNEVVLNELEAVFNKTENSKGQSSFSAFELAGVWNKEDAALINKAIEEGCEQIHPDDWKQIYPGYKYYIISAWLEGDKNIAANIDNADFVYVPVIVIGELYYGASFSTQILKNVNNIRKITSHYPILFLSTQSYS